MDLKQGNMTFSEYGKKFNELSKFGSSLIDIPLKKNEKFIAAARPEYYDRLTTHVHSSFASLMDMAIRFENIEGNQREKCILRSLPLVRLDRGRRNARRRVVWVILQRIQLTYLLLLSIDAIKWVTMQTTVQYHL